MAHSIIAGARWLVRADTTTAAVIQTTILQLVTVAANVATGIITARVLAPSGRGELAALNLAPSFLGLFLTFGVPSALLYNLKRHADDSRSSIGAALVCASVFGCVGIVGAYFIVPTFLHEYSHRVVVLAQVFLLTVPLTLYMYVCASVFESDGKFWSSNGTRVLAPLLTLTLLVVLACFGRLDASSAAASYAVPALIIGAKMLLDTVRGYRPTFLPMRSRTYCRLAAYGIRSFGIDLLKTIGQQIDQLLVVAFLSPTAMGLYAVSLALSRLPLLLQSSVVRVLLPRLAARPTAEVVAATGRAVRITSLITLLPFLTLIVLAPQLLHLAYGSKYIDAANVTRVLSIEALFAGAGSTLSQAFLAVGRPGSMSVLQAAGLAISIPLMLVLIPHFGILGAALALLVSTVARFAFVIVCFPLLLKVSPPMLYINQQDIKELKRRMKLMLQWMPQSRL